MGLKIRSAWCLAGALVVAGPAGAQGLGQEALSESLFQDGRKLMEQGNFAEACPKLAESHAIDPAGGTVLLLALCYEQLGKTASAWVKFNEALASARRDGRSDRVERATSHIAQLEPKLSRLTVSVPAEAASQEGLELLLDGVVLPRVAWSRELPTDPGLHKVEARAPGRRTWSRDVDLGGNGARQAVEVPLLEVLVKEGPAAPVAAPVAAPPAAPREPATADEGSSGKTVAYLVGGLGVLALSVGGYYGVRALGRNADARDVCPSNECENPAGVGLNEDARKDAMRANVLMGAGVVLTGIGAYLWLSSGEGREGTALVVGTQPSGGVGLGSVTRW
jgi:serine/threonine-protein kinase